MEKRDVVVVGGGLAGLTTAKFLAEHGIDVLLLEEDDEFFRKPCGEGILPISNENLFFELYDSKAGIEGGIEEVVMFVGKDRISLPVTFLMIDKKTVEKELGRQVERFGGEIWMGEKVKRIEEGIVLPQNIRAKVVVGADGARSVVRESAGISSPKIGIGVEGKMNDMEELEKEKAYVWFGRNFIPGGYAWAFPKAKYWNVGIGSCNIKSLKIYLQRFKARFKEIKELRGAGIPFSLPTKSYGKDFILVGDSASQIMTAVGAGNLPSMICGYEGARAIISHLEKGTDLKDYEKRWRRELGLIFYESFMLCKMGQILSRVDTDISRPMIRLLKKIFA
ncbi:MAG: hypothetical protein DRN18_02090 [Thermoplasmata archaeon]|nr:MAG: hypothetical protein DRN18_02090 [Thermoplasmata archaeon]